MRPALPPALVVIVFVAAIAMPAAVVVAQVQGPTVADPPILVPGDTWTIRHSDGARGKKTFLKEDAGILIFEVSQTWQDGKISQGFLHQTRDLSTVRMLDAGGAELQRFDPHSLGLRFPLAVGKEWQGRSRRFDEGRLVGTYEGTYKVVRVEAVRVPAGTFQAFRVEGRTHELQAPTKVWRFIHWYAPEVRMEVKLRGEEPDGGGTYFELVEFRPAGSTRPPATFAAPAAFLGVWEGYWRETILATKLTVEKIEGDTASVIYWRGAYRFPGLQRPRQQRAEGRFLDGKTLKLEIWDDAGRRWAEVTYTLGSDGTLTGGWRSGDSVASAILKKEQ
jgi:hypothetical protein